MKVAILTFHNAINYGAILQCFALQEFISRKFDCEVDVLNYTPKKFHIFYDPTKPFKAPGLKNKTKAIIKYFIRHKEIKYQGIKYKALTSYIENNINTTMKITNLSNSLDYDCFIVGSDQVWNLKMTGNDESYFLNFTDRKKISYAASFKIDNIDDFAYKVMQDNLIKFNSISVREKSSFDYLKEHNIISQIVLDPTLLLDKSMWKTIIQRELKLNFKYALIYYVNPPKKLIDEAFEYCSKNGIKLVSLNTIRTEKRDYVDYSYASIDEFLSLVLNAECVFTTSFHGLAFSINFNREFYFEVPLNSDNNNARLLDITNSLNLQSRNIYVKEQKAINWEEVNEKLNSLRDFSTKFLEDNLK